MLKSKRFLLISCVILACVGSLTYALSLATSPNQGKAGRSDNASNSLNVISTTVVGRRVKVVLKNVSTKTINGVQLAVGGTRVQIDFLDADDPSLQSLEPGAVYEDWFSLSSESDGGRVDVLAVLFQDGNGVGDGRFINEVKDVRAGERALLTRLIPLLREAEASPETDATVILDKLERDILALSGPHGREEVLRGNVRVGMHNGKQRVLEKIRRLKQSHVDRGLPLEKRSLSRMTDRLEEKLLKLTTPRTP